MATTVFSVSTMLPEDQEQTGRFLFLFSTFSFGGA